jgi:hypothetical protein|uniref:Thioredoxin-like fold domain-containing protein n=1 Tax=Desulfomonile tiedjei TaxID=2358 RepID=A0A7C4ARE8_9BACT
MQKQDVITVQVLTTSGKAGSCATCGGTSLNPKLQNMLATKVKELTEALEASCPGKTQVSFVNVKESLEAQNSEAGQLLETGQYPPPLILINGEPRFAGYIDVDKIVHEVKKAIAK